MATNANKTRPKSGNSARQQPSSVPAFRVRRGEHAIGLLRQVDLSPPASRIGVSRDGRWLAVSAASRRAGNLSLYDLATGSLAWRGTVDAPSARVFALDDGGCIAITQSGRVGAGTTEMHFVDPGGHLHASVRLDDKLTEVQLVDGGVIVGCRDGQLSRYDLTGALSWTYAVPAYPGLRAGDPHQRACPYVIRASAAGDHILLSSWDRVFMLERSGVPRWTWQTTTESSKRFTVPLPRPIASAEHYRLLAKWPAPTAAPYAATPAIDQIRRYVPVNSQTPT